MFAVAAAVSNNAGSPSALAILRSTSAASVSCPRSASRTVLLPSPPAASTTNDPLEPIRSTPASSFSPEYHSLVIADESSSPSAVYMIPAPGLANQRVTAVISFIRPKNATAVSARRDDMRGRNHLHAAGR